MAISLRISKFGCDGFDNIRPADFDHDLLPFLGTGPMHLRNTGRGNRLDIKPLKNILRIRPQLELDFLPDPRIFFRTDPVLKQFQFCNEFGRQ